MGLASNPRHFSTLSFVALFVLECGVASFAWDTTSAWSSNSLQSEKRMQKESEDVLEALLQSDAEKCSGKRCVHTDQCCPGAVCVDVDGMAGTCLPIYGVSEGETCESDTDCEAGLHCMENPSAASVQQRLKICQPLGLNIRKKQYNDECATTAECDATRGLCCQLIRRHRMAQRKLCYYFTDPKSCIGTVDMTRLKPLQHGIPNPIFKARIG